MYFDCDESEGDYTYDDDSEFYYVYDARRTDCSSTGSDTFYHEAKDEYDEEWYPFSTHYCSSEHDSYWGCATWDEETVYTAEDSFDEDPCKIKDGSYQGNSCNVDNDCISLDCSGNRFEYFSECIIDGEIYYNLTIYDYDNTCGGDGYLASVDESDQYDCDLYDSNSVCDTDLTGYGISSASIFCKKAPDKSCSVNSDC